MNFCSKGTTKSDLSHPPIFYARIWLIYQIFIFFDYHENIFYHPRGNASYDSFLLSQGNIFFCKLSCSPVGNARNLSSLLQVRLLVTSWIHSSSFLCRHRKMVCQCIFPELFLFLSKLQFEIF